MKIEFTVPGQPQGKARPRVTRSGHAFTPTKTKEYEERIRLCWKRQSGKSFPEGTAIAAEVRAYFQIPASLSKAKQQALVGEPHTKKCDIDNLLKACFDALNGYAYHDDSAICEVTATKLYALIPRVEIVLQSVEPESEQLQTALNDFSD